MSDDIRKETERIHQGIVESLSFSEALAKRDAEIERLRGLLREGLGLVDEDWTLKDPIHLGEWEDRVREALGE